MDKIQNLKYYRGIFNGSFRYKDENILIDEAVKYGFDIEKDICYLQNMFIADKKSKLYVFSENKVVTFCIDNENDANVTVHICNKIDLKNISYTHAYFDSEYKVEFTMNSEKITLDPNCDTNERHSNSFHENLKYIIDYLKSI